MEKEKIVNLVKKKGTLGVLTLCLVGAAAFASYRTSYPNPQPSKEDAQKEISTEKETSFEPAKEAAASDILAKVEEEPGFMKANELDVDPVKSQELIQNEAGAETEGISEAITEETTEETKEAVAAAAILPTVSFNEESALIWPAAGTILMDYNMDGTVYFKTLNEYKYNPALIIGSAVGNPVVASAKGIVRDIKVDQETGTTVTLGIGDDYELIYGQLKEIVVSKGDVVEQGDLLGYISEPTKYYCEEGSNLYFAMKKDGQIVDPCMYLEQ